jgi:hypothetical protein
LIWVNRTQVRDPGGIGGQGEHAKAIWSLRGEIAAKVSPVPVTSCWEWTGARDDRGYGNVRDGNRVRKAHVVIYEHFNGPVPPGQELDHRCRVPWCVNPAHMEAVTHVENVRRGAARWVPGARQRAKRRCPAGHAYTKANTYVQTSTGGRACRTCDRNRKRARGRRHDPQAAAYAPVAPT